MGSSLQRQRPRGNGLQTNRRPPPPLPKAVEAEIDQVIRKALEVAATPPQNRTETPLPRWTLKRLVTWVREKFKIDCCRDTVRKVLKRLGFSWKKARKLLNKASTQKRGEYLAILEGLMQEALENDHLLVFIDEAHIHLDTDEGYGWSVKGERFWVSSCSPGLAKVSFYGVYLYNLGQVRLFPYEVANGLNSIDVLKRISAEFPDQKMTAIWDGAPYHRAQAVKDEAKNLNLNLQPLSAYSPDFMPVEHLWQWFREDLTYHTCYENQDDLIQQVQLFQQRLNQTPLDIAERLWVKSHLDPKEEKLRVSS
jgi:transposase